MSNPTHDERSGVDRWALVQRLFHGALERPREARRDWLAGAAGSDLRLRGEVEALLAADDAPLPLLERRPVDLLEAPLDDALGRRRLAPGDRLGPYRVERGIGEGGMGIVHLVTDTRDGGAAALKVLRRTVADTLIEAQARARFLREIRVGARLAHPHLLPVLDSGETEGRLWFTMPYVHGETLRARLARGGALALAAALAIARPLAAALAWLARHGFVHRDVKPENVLLGDDGRVLLADFSVVRALEAGDADQRLTMTGIMVGTRQYMSPEQIRGQRAEPAADVYALGAVLHEMLAGRPPFGGDGLREALHAALRGRPVRPPALDGVPRALARLVQAMLAGAPADRPSADAVAARLAALAPPHSTA
ncbi:MAG TPA: serine/threonine-protein kinase [Gemmatimonadaceae bacterium]|nr:serine/threonine-protein kinase [Gemmatimonadaceae bacterium]